MSRSRQSSQCRNQLFPTESYVLRLGSPAHLHNYWGWRMERVLRRPGFLRRPEKTVLLHDSNAGSDRDRV